MPNATRPFAIADVYKTRESLRTERTSNALKGLETLDLLQDISDRTTLRRLARQHSATGTPNYQRISTDYMQQTGDIEKASEIGAMPQKKSLAKIEHVSKQLEAAKGLAEMALTVADEPTYQRYRVAAQQFAKATGQKFGLPERYDPKFFEGVRRRAMQYSKLMQIPGAPAGTIGQRDQKSGKWSTVVKPTETKPPSGYRYTAEGSALEAIPGGPEDPATIQRQDSAKPSTSIQKYRELIEMGAPPNVAKGAAFGTLKEMRDNRGNPVLIDTMTGDLLGHMERDPETSQYRWVTNKPTKKALDSEAAESIPPLEQRQMWKVYQTPMGPMQWRGTGWKPVKQ